MDPNKTSYGRPSFRTDRSRAKARRKFYAAHASNMNMTRGASYTDFPRNTAHKPGTEQEQS